MRQDVVREVEKLIKGWVPRDKKSFTASEVLKERTKLEKEYGDRIVAGKIEDMPTAEEKAAKIGYDTLTETLHKMAPATKVPDGILRAGIRAKEGIKSLYIVTKKVFLFVLGILLMLAAIKYLLTY